MSTAAIISDSRVALATISCEEDVSLRAQRVARKLHAMQQTGGDLSLHWVPPHIEIGGRLCREGCARPRHRRHQLRVLCGCRRLLTAP
ncbi:hypothetical protein MRX96_031028 [Rhipicephalus microplus]